MRLPPECKACFVRFDAKSKEFQLGADRRCDGRCITPQEAGKLYEARFLSIARDNPGVSLPVDSHIFLKLQADEHAPHQYTYKGFVWGGHWYPLPAAYVAFAFTIELLRLCKARCGTHAHRLLRRRAGGAWRRRGERRRHRRVGRHQAAGRLPAGRR